MLTKSPATATILARSNFVAADDSALGQMLFDDLFESNFFGSFWQH
ncbi:MAG TPA: hypothetical protein VEP90_14280 [Methylomirabilota bacterium]|nr:hypothetical protein [Methylomirabilota bacterium]